jgi:hypothetical protein
VQFIVDSLGMADTASLKLIRAPSAALAATTKRAMRHWRFTPAMAAGCRVSQLTQVVLAIPMSDDTRVFVEAFRATDTLGYRAARLLRPELAEQLTDRAFVVRTRDIDEFLSLSNDPLPWNWENVREAAKLLRTGIVIDIHAQSTAGQVTLTSYRVLPRSRAIDTLPPVHASSIDAAIRLLARQIARDTLFRP